MRYNEKSLDWYQLEFFKNFPTSNIKILATKGTFLIVEDNYGQLKIWKQNLLKNGKVTINSAIDKTKYFSNRFYEKFPHSTLKILNYMDCDNVLVEDEFGVCKTRAEHLMKGIYPTSQVAVDKSKYIINQFKAIWGDTYDYSETKIKNCAEKVKISCKKHNVFQCTPTEHLQRIGCRKCANEKISERVFQEGNLFRAEDWYKKSLKSKHFDSFKVYIIKCWAEDEIFYKIGKTYRDLKYRFKVFDFKTCYSYKIIGIYEIKEQTLKAAEFISKLEKELHKENKLFKYIPFCKFDGSKECFSNYLTNI